MLQGTSSPFVANMDSQDVPIDLTGSTPFHLHILSIESSDLTKAQHNTRSNTVVHTVVLLTRMHLKNVTLYFLLYSYQNFHQGSRFPWIILPISSFTTYLISVTLDLGSKIVEITI